jgi:hypothetical protein
MRAKEVAFASLADKSLLRERFFQRVIRIAKKR